jgi:hypothetical protein
VRDEVRAQALAGMSMDDSEPLLDLLMTVRGNLATSAMKCRETEGLPPTA